MMCPIMGMMEHYFLLVSFSWMLIEGIQFYRMVNNVFYAWTTKLTVFYFLVAYAVPLLIFFITILTASFTEEDVLGAYAGYEPYL